MISGSSSAHMPWPVHMIGLTRSWWLSHPPRPRVRAAAGPPDAVAGAALVVPPGIGGEGPQRAASQLAAPSGCRQAPRPSTSGKRGRGPRARPAAAVIGQVGQHVGERGQPEHARAALAGVLPGQVADHPGRLGEPAGRRGSTARMPAPMRRRPPAGPHGSSGRATRVGGQPRTEITADEDGLSRSAAAGQHRISPMGVPSSIS